MDRNGLIIFINPLWIIHHMKSGYYVNSYIAKAIRIKMPDYNIRDWFCNPKHELIIFMNSVKKFMHSFLKIIEYWPIFRGRGPTGKVLLTVKANLSSVICTYTTHLSYIYKSRSCILFVKIFPTWYLRVIINFSMSCP